MDLIYSLGVWLIGFLAGTFLFSRVGHWLAALYEIYKSQAELQTKSKLPRYLLATFVNSGSWALIVFTFVGILLRNQSWAATVLTGLIAAIIFFAFLSAFIARRVIAKRSKSLTT
jgi:hypothetical protein